MTTDQVVPAAVKMAIGDLLSGQYVAAEGSALNYLLTGKQQRIVRANVLGVLLDKEVIGTVTTLFLDDGSGTLRVRCFEEFKTLPLLIIGKAVLVIGRIREYNGEKYLSPDIVKAVDTKWLRVRALELRQENGAVAITAEPIISASPEESTQLPALRLLQLIRELDQGSGVLIDDVVEKSPLTGTEALLEKMIEGGEIFQNMPGKVKVL